MNRSQAAEEIRRREQNRTTNQTPTVEQPGAEQQPDLDDSGRLSGISVPLPSLSKRHVGAIALVLAIVVAWKLYQRQQQAGGPATAARSGTEQDGDETNPEANPTPTGDGEIEVPVRNDDPLAGDEAITAEFRRRGLITGGGED